MCSHPRAPLRSGARVLLSSQQPLCLTEGLSKILAQADVGELQHLSPFLTLAFPVSATTCRARKIGTVSCKIGTVSYDARTPDCSLALPGAASGDTLCPSTRASPGKENKTEVVPLPPGCWNSRATASDYQMERTDQPLWLLNKVPAKNEKTFTWTPQLARI